MESLESRQLMAGDIGAEFDAQLSAEEPSASERTAVISAAPNKPLSNITATLAGGNLYLSEGDRRTGLKHGVTVSKLANGNILLTGHDPTNSGGASSVINGAPSAEFTVTGSLFVNLGGGEDQIIFDTSAGAAPSFYDVALNMGTDASVDRVIMWSLNTTGSLNVDTGGGNDWVFLGGPVIGDGFGWDSFTVNSGAGADNVTVKNGTQIKGWVDIQTYSALSETDSDLVHFDTEVFVQRGVDVRMGGGDDEFTVTRPDLEQVYYGGLHANGAITVNLGDGADTAYLRGVRTNSNLNVFSGAGADDVTIDSRTIYNPFFDTYYIASVGGNMEVQTYDSLEETDADEVRLYDGRISGSLLARLGGGDDFFQLTYADYIHNDLNVEMGAGNDTAEISAFVLDHLMAWMGEGNDVLHLGKTWAYRLIADGGLGGDSLTTASDTQSTYRDLFGWEYINGFPTWWDDIVYDDEGGGVLSP